jgi:hypothetical protein
VQSGKTSEEIEVVTSSESASSTSGCDDVESDAEQEAEVDGTRRPPGEGDFSLDVMVKNTKSGIIHSPTLPLAFHNPFVLTENFCRGRPRNVVV